MNHAPAKRRLGWLAGIALLLAPVAASAHTKLTDPAPRVDSDAIKTGPCGTDPKKTPIQYAPGQQLTVHWREGIDHPGCFDILFSPANDANWQRLARIPDGRDGGNQDFSMAVTLPSTPCNNCTLSVRQLMTDSAGGMPCTATTLDALDGGVPTYFSCADIRIGDAGATEEDDSGATPIPILDSGTKSDGGNDDPNSDGPGAANLHSGAGSSSCDIGWSGSTGALGLLAGTGLLAAVLVRRRRNRSA